MTQKKIVNLKSAEEFKTNPFVVELKGKMYLQPRADTIISKGQKLVDTTTGEIINESVVMGKRKIVDKSHFAKLYASNIAVLYELSKPAQNVFMHLSKVMDYDNRAYFNYFKDYGELKYKSHQPCLKGLRELLTESIIACDIREHQYWLNPTIICKGERFAMYTEYVTEEYVEKENLLNEQNKSKFNSLDSDTKAKLDLINNDDFQIKKDIKKLPSKLKVNSIDSKLDIVEE